MTEQTVLKLIEGELTVENDGPEIQELMKKLTAAILDARDKSPNLDSYYEACNLVNDLARQLHDLAEGAEVTIEIDSCEGLGMNGYLPNSDYGDWVDGAYLAGTWVPSSLGC